MHTPKFLAIALCAFVGATSLDAQTTLIPSGMPPQATSNNAFPWNRQSAQQIRVIHQYGASNFAAIGHPIFIQKLRFRAWDTSARTWTGGTYTGARITMSTAKTSYTAIDLVYDNNHGLDKTQMYPTGTGLGPVVVQPGTHNAVGPGPFYIEVTLNAPGFPYDPASGNDLCIDIQHDGMNLGTMSSNQTATYPANVMPACSRLYNTSDMNATTATGMTINYGPAIEVDWLPQKGLFASFTATPTSGPANTTVQFTDTSFSSAPGGVLGWVWDFGDSSPTSALQNPSHTYKCGVFSPKLTVIDASHPMNTRQYTDLISVGVVEADFTASGTFGVAPYSVTFTDTSAGGPGKWLWDFGDGSATSTLQNPTHIYVTGGKFTVSLTCGGQCNKDQEIKVDLIEVCAPNSPNSGSITTLIQGGNGLTSPGCGNLFDAEIANPDGIKVTSIDVNSRGALGLPIDIEVWITPGSYIGNDNLPGIWVMVSKGSALSAGPGATVATPIDVDDFYLAPGKYGIYIIYNAGGIHYTNGNGTNQNYKNCDLKLSLGVGKNVKFSGGLFNPRIWNGTIHYDKNDTAANGRFGYGCPGSNAAVGDLSMSAEPTLGGSGNLTVTGTPATPVAPGFLFIGATKQLMDLTMMGMTGCFLHTDIFLTVGIASLNGTATLPFAIPTSPTLIGSRALMQAAIVDAGANGLGVSMTNGLNVRLGL